MTHTESVVARKTTVLSALLWLNAVATLAAGLVLFVAPDSIAGTVGIYVGQEAHFLYYLLGASELGLSALCFLGLWFRDRSTLITVSLTLIVFHVASGVAGVYAFARGVDAAVLWNVVARVVMVVLFGYHGVYKLTLSKIER
ncbi:MAG: hypothetical protein M3N33_02000 [Actinomycetota bacterium]|nr:hypothetical protein [Actinomycetota bacterium]